MLKTRYLLLFFVLSSSLVQAQRGLQEFLTLAEKNSPALLDNFNQIEISHIESERLRRELIGPRVFASADYLLAPYFNNPTFIDANPQPQAIGYDVNVTNGGQYAALLNVSQPILAGKTLEANLKLQGALRSKSGFTRDITKRNLFKQVTDQYIKVFQDQKNTENDRKLLSIISDQVTIFSRLVKSGLRKQSDALLIDLERKNQETSLRTSENLWQEDMRDLYTLCGLSDTAIVQLKRPELVTGLLPETGDSFLGQYTADSAKVVASAAVFNSKYRPTINLFGNAGLNAVSLDGIQRKVGFSIGAGITIPIFDGNQRNLNDQKSQIALQTIAQYKAQKQIEVSNNLSKFQKAIADQSKNLQILEDQETDYQALFDQYKAELSSGLISVLDYVNAIRMYRTFQTNLINARSKLLSLEAAYRYWSWD